MMPITSSLTDYSVEVEENRTSSRAERAERLGLIGTSPAMKLAQARLEKVAQSDLPVLIRGETGTGKELAARAIHEMSARKDGPFVSENCAAIADGILEAELFGHERGAFTGADDAREGLFEKAHGGTLFIDEVGDMSLGMQAKLLRVLQEGEVRRMGSSDTLRVSVRVIAATHRNLDELVKQGKFRADLLFRLHVLEVVLPPLRERREDIPEIAQHFLARFAAEMPDRSPLGLSEAALDALLGHDWPGNIRELENALRVAALFTSGPLLDVDHRPVSTAKTSANVVGAAAVAQARGLGDHRLSYEDLLEALAERERRYLRAVMEEEKGNKAKVARRLGITRYALYRVLRRLDIDPAEFDEVASR